MGFFATFVFLAILASAAAANLDKRSPNSDTIDVSVRRIRAIRQLADVPDEMIADAVRASAALSALQNSQGFQQNPNAAQTLQGNGEFQTDGNGGITTGTGTTTLASQFAASFLPLFNTLFG